MRFYLDCEWDSPDGQTLSIALVPADPAVAPFYIFDPNGALAVKSQWVRNNVLPVLMPGDSDIGLASVDDVRRFGFHISNYLTLHQGAHTIVADWFEDIARFCLAVLNGPGKCHPMPMNLAFMVLRGDNKPGDVPHNALSDARALRDHWETKR